MRLLPMDRLGARETAPNVVQFGVLFPEVGPARGNLAVKLIHEDDQFLQDAQPVEIAMTHSIDPDYGDYWSAQIDLTQPRPNAGHSWGRAGRYVYRYILHAHGIGDIDWIIDPFAREFGIGKFSAFTIGFTPHPWSDHESQWRTPRLEDLVVYELMIQEFGGTLEGTAERLPYLADLGVNCIEIMPLSNVAASLDWGFTPLGHFGPDERFGNRRALQRLVDLAHQNGIAVVADVIYGHTGDDFAYEYLYSRLGITPNPFMGDFAKNMFGPNTDWNRPYVRDFYFTANIKWLEWFHLDGFRYDCVPNYWDGPAGIGYNDLVFQTYQHVKSQNGADHWARFSGGGRLNIIQIAEQLEAPKSVVADTYSNSTWQNDTYAAARDVAHAGDGAIGRLGHALGLEGYPVVVTHNGTDTVAKAPLQYIENHDHERFVTNFGMTNDPEPLLRDGDRSNWARLQPYLIALLLAKGVPLLWEGQELCESYFVPESGRGRIALLRPVRWNFFYDEAGRGTIALVRKLLALRKARPEFRGGEFFFYDHADRYQNHGVLLFGRWTNASFSLVGVNFSGSDATVPFWFPGGGPYEEQLHHQDNLPAAAPLSERLITIPSNYGRVWSSP
ncbi:MAG TPA: alpha-amylase family glycosyl hydrolase [Thermoanaerobaculia bacterium]|jgi:1,4-alpha-glucan branching enzyme